MINYILYPIINLLITFVDNLNIPAIPENTLENVYDFLDLIFSYTSFLNVLFSVDAIKILFPILITVISIKYSYMVLMWVVRKVPFIGIR